MRSRERVASGSMKEEGGWMEGIEGFTGKCQNQHVGLGLVPILTGQGDIREVGVGL